MHRNGTQTHSESVDDLRFEHGNLDARLRQLDRHRSLSPEEQYEANVIKKRKLALKDRISRLEGS